MICLGIFSAWASVQCVCFCTSGVPFGMGVKCTNSINIEYLKNTSGYCHLGFLCCWMEHVVLLLWGLLSFGDWSVADNEVLGNERRLWLSLWSGFFGNELKSLCCLFKTKNKTKKTPPTRKDVFWLWMHVLLFQPLWTP